MLERRNGTLCCIRPRGVSKGMPPGEECFFFGACAVPLNALSCVSLYITSFVDGKECEQCTKRWNLLKHVKVSDRSCSHLRAAIDHSEGRKVVDLAFFYGKSCLDEVSLEMKLVSDEIALAAEQYAARMEK